MNKKEYAICLKRKHQKSNLKIDGWDICEFCGVKFRYVTRLEEQIDAEI